VIRRKRIGVQVQSGRIFGTPPGGNPQLDPLCPLRYNGGMSATPDDPTDPGAARRKPAANPRDQRLKAALKANMARRKAQARAREDKTDVLRPDDTDRQQE
jgi:hypothetical protein